MKHRNTDGLSEIGKYVIGNCEHAYVENGQVFDPCHTYFSKTCNINSWNPDFIENEEK